jgi:hypothetical protein
MIKCAIRDCMKYKKNKTKHKKTLHKNRAVEALSSSPTTAKKKKKKISTQVVGLLYSQ